MSRESFVGTWRLVAANFYKADGTLVKLYGDEPKGIFVYDDGGRMCVQIMEPERPLLPPGHLAEHASDDYQRILIGYIAYFGTYDVDEAARTVTHHVQGSLIPNWVGTDLVRGYEFSGTRLTLRTSASRLRGELMRGELIWERMYDGLF